MSGHRVFITGLSALTATGNTLDTTWAALKAGESGINEIKYWDISAWTHRLGGELKNFEPAKMLPDRKLMKVVSRHDVMGIYAATQAVEHSQMMEYRHSLADANDFNENTGVYVGSPGNKYYQQYDFLSLMAKAGDNLPQFANELFSEVHPMWLLRILPNNVLAYTGINYGFKGPNQNITNHAVSGTQAIIEAYHAINSGQVERAVVVAYDVATEPQAVFYYDKLGVVSNRHLKPFDAEHDGTILAEGASALVLESEASVMARSATCYGELSGGLSASESQGLFSIAADGKPLASLLTNVLEQQQLNPLDIGLVVAHGNGNPKSDISEANALHSVFGEYQVPVTAFKWSIGHTICASGILDAVLATYALHKRCIPGIANFEQIASDCIGLNVSCEHRDLPKTSTNALIVSRGYAGMNACLVIKSC